MRIKKKHMVVTFRTTTDAMAFENFCNKNRIPGRLIPVPGEISAGCGLAWKCLPEDMDLVYPILEKNGVLYERITELLL